MSEKQTASQQIPETPPLFNGDNYPFGGIPPEDDIVGENNPDQFDDAKNSDEDHEASQNREKISASDALKVAYYGVLTYTNERRSEKSRERLARLERKKTVYSEIGDLMLRGEKHPDAKFSERRKAKKAMQKRRKASAAAYNADYARRQAIPGVYGKKRVKQTERQLARSQEKVSKSVFGDKYNARIDKKISATKDKIYKKDGNYRYYEAVQQGILEQYGRSNADTDYGEQEVELEIQDKPIEQEPTTPSSPEIIEEQDNTEVQTENQSFSEADIASGQPVAILNSNGDKENGWTIVDYDADTKKVLVSRPKEDGSGKHKGRYVSLDKLTKDTVEPAQAEKDGADLDKLKEAQRNRDMEQSSIIEKLREAGHTDKQIEGYKASIVRMKEAELKRGRLFASQSEFIEFEHQSR